MENQKQPQLLLLCEDVKMEIVKYLDIKGMQSLSLTCKWGFDATKEHLEKQCKLVFSKSLSLKEMQSFAMKRNYDEIVGSVYNFDEIILQQLAQLNIKVCAVNLIVNRSYKLQELCILIANLKAKYNIDKVLINTARHIKCLKDIQKMKDENININDIRSVRLSVNNFNDDFEEGMLPLFVNEFRALDTLYVWNDSAIQTPIDGQQPLNLRTLQLYNGELSNQLSFLQLFQGLHTLIVINCWDSFCLQTLINLSKHTLKKLQLDFYRTCKDNLVVPCQLKVLRVSGNTEVDATPLLSNQLELEYLKLGVSFTRPLLRKLGDNCPATLNIKYCDYNFYEGNAADLRSCIPELPMVQHLKICHMDLIDFLPKTQNIESLEILIIEKIRKDEDRGFAALDGLEMNKLTFIYIWSQYADIVKAKMLELSEITMKLPRLERVRCLYPNFVFFEKYPNIKYLDSGFCEFDDIVLILKVLPNLEELKVHINSADMRNVIRHLKTSNFGEDLKYFVITTISSCKQFDVVKQLERMGYKLFAKYSISEDYLIGGTIDIDIKNKCFMYKYVD